MQKWTSIIQECINSGLPVRQWYNQNGILEGSYYYWLKKYVLNFRGSSHSHSRRYTSASFSK
jgi:hypothetical protein